MKKRFHIVSLPHTQTTNEYCWCAYTAKVKRFCDMMTSLEHEVFLYAGVENEAKVKEHVSIVTRDDLKSWYPQYDDSQVFGDWNSASPGWVEMNRRAVEEIKKRQQPGDILGIIGGTCQEAIAMGLPGMRSVEWGIGYEGIMKEGLHVFESYAWMHHVYGMQGIRDGRFFDAVIPNAFDDADYTFEDKKSDYLLYLGRLTPRKGLEVVKELASVGHKIVTAGQGSTRIPGTEHVGVVRGGMKASLISNAKALLVPTFYIEPFGGVVIEALLSGTPVITTDFGAFSETVREGIDGFRCHTMGEFEEAVYRVKDLDHKKIRANAERYLTENVRHEYEKYFNRVSLLDGKGWYA